MRALLCWMESERLPVLCGSWDSFSLQLPAVFLSSFVLSLRPKGVLVQIPTAYVCLHSSLPGPWLAEPWCFSLLELQLVALQTFKTSALSLASSSLVQGGGRSQDLTYLCPFAGIIVLLRSLSHRLKAFVSYILSSFLVVHGPTASSVPLYQPSVRGWQQ